MTRSQRNIAFFILGLFFVGLRVARGFVAGGVPDGVAFAIAGVSLFRFGYTLQHHAVENLKKFRVTPRTAVWFASAVSFWYSTLIWIWWSRRTPNFPLFLLNDELRTTLFFDWVPVLVAFGLFLEARSARRAH